MGFKVRTRDTGGQTLRIGIWDRLQMKMENGQSRIQIITGLVNMSKMLLGFDTGTVEFSRQRTSCE